MKIHLYGDFNNCTEDYKIRLITVGSLRDIEQKRDKLSDGLTVILSDNEIEVEAHLERDERDEMWLGVPDWSTRRDVV